MVLKITDPSDDADSSSATLNSSVEQVDLSQRASITSLDDLKASPTGSNLTQGKIIYESKPLYEKNIESEGRKTNKVDSERKCTEEIENIIQKLEGDTTDPRHSKPTDCDLIELQKVINFNKFYCSF